MFIHNQYLTKLKLKFGYPEWIWTNLQKSFGKRELIWLKIIKIFTLFDLKKKLVGFKLRLRHFNYFLIINVHKNSFWIIELRITDILLYMNWRWWTEKDLLDSINIDIMPYNLNYFYLSANAYYRYGLNNRYS